MKHVSRFGGKSSELLNIKAHGTYTYHCALKGKYRDSSVTSQQTDTKCIVGHICKREQSLSRYFISNIYFGTVDRYMHVFVFIVTFMKEALAFPLTSPCSLAISFLGDSRLVFLISAWKIPQDLSVRAAVLARFNSAQVLYRPRQTDTRILDRSNVKTCQICLLRLREGESWRVAG
jgi:hypothetical protein